MAVPDGFWTSGVAGKKELVQDLMNRGLLQVIDDADLPVNGSHKGTHIITKDTRLEYFDDGNNIKNLGVLTKTIGYLRNFQVKKFYKIDNDILSRMTAGTSGTPTDVEHVWNRLIGIDSAVDEHKSYRPPVITIFNNFDGSDFLIGHFKTDLNIFADNALTLFLGLLNGNDHATRVLPNTEQHIGFMIEDQILYAQHGDGIIRTRTDIVASAGSNKHYTFIYDVVAGNITYYIDGVLVATHNTDLPTGGNAAPYFIWNSDGLGAASVTYQFGPGVFLEV